MLRSTPQVLVCCVYLPKVLLSKNCGGRYCTANHAEALGIDAINNMIALEDLGKPMIFTILYDEKRKLQEQELNQLVGYLNGLHKNFRRRWLMMSW
jgi:hypothetical protein